MRYLLALAIVAPALTATADEVVVKAARVYTMAGPPLAPGAVHIKGGRIVAVAETLAAPDGVRVIDLGNGVLMPGLIDAYSTIGVEGGDSESTVEVTPNVRVLDAVDWAAKAFRQTRSDGTTTVGLVPGTDNVIAGLSCVVKTGGDPKTRIVQPDGALVLTLASDPGSGNSARNRPDSIYNRMPTNRMGVVWILRSEFTRARDSKEARTAVLREALDAKRPVLCVSRTDADIAAVLRLKKEYPMALTIAGGQEAYKMRAELAAAKVPVLLGPISATAGSGPENTETILNLAGVLHDAGIPIALTGGRLLDQARLAVRFGLPRDIALAAITATPAKLLGVDGRLGTIAAGRDADLVALTGDPFEIATAVRWTCVGGIRTEEP